MKKNEVPQDDGPLKKNKSTELIYAVDEDNKFVPVQSSGWAPKSVIQYKNLESIEQRIKKAKRDMDAGISSPIVYYMEVHRMDWNTLAAYMNKWTYFVKRHAKPQVFAKLSQKTLEKYADVFDITIEELLSKNAR